MATMPRHFWLTLLAAAIEVGFALEIVVPEFKKLPPEITYVDEKASFPLSLTFHCEAEPVGRVEIQFYSSSHAGALKQLSTSPNEGVNVIGSGKLLLSDLTRERVQRMISQQEVFHCKANVGRFTLLSRPFAIREAYIREFSVLSDPSSSSSSAKEIRQVSFLRGNIAQINCILPDSEPPAQAIFKINDSTQYPDERFRVVKLAAPKTYAMLIKHVKASDRGVYTCVARNPFTMRTVQSNFVYNFSVTAPISDIHPVFMFIPAPVNYVMFEGDNATFSCVVSSAPIAQIKFQRSWASKDDVHLSSRFTVDRQFNLLTLHGATHKDNGGYVCRALYGRKDGARLTPLNSFFSITVKKRLKITVGPKDASIGEGTNGVDFNCRVSGDFNSPNSETLLPIPQWYINGAPVTSHNTVGVRLDESRLIVFDPKPQHYGIVQCVASVNDVWTSQHAIFSLAEDTILRGVNAAAGRLPKIEYRLKHVDVGSTQLLECVGLSDWVNHGELQLVWRYGDRVLNKGQYSSSASNFGKYGVHGRYLQVAQVSNQDQGNYTCFVYARNGSVLFITTTQVAIAIASKTNSQIGEPPNPKTEEPTTHEQLGESDTNKEYENCISKPAVDWPYLSLAVDIKWHINTPKRHLLPLIEHFRFVYKLRSARNRRFKNWTSIKEKVVDFIFKNKYYRPVSSGVRRRRQSSDEGGDSNDINLDKSYSNKEPDNEAEPLKKYSFLYTLQNKDSHKIFKAQTYYIFQVQYSIQSRHFMSEWSEPLIFNLLLDTPPPAITSATENAHGITWEFETDNGQATSFMILSRRVNNKKLSMDQMKRYTVEDPNARQYYFHDLVAGYSYELRMFAKIDDKRTDLSSPIYLNAKEVGIDQKSVVPSRPTQIRKSGTNSDDSNRLLFIIVGSLVGGLFFFLVIITVACCLKQSGRRMRTGAFLDPAKTIHRETLLRSQMQPTMQPVTHNNFSLSMLNGGPLSHAASPSPLTSNGTLSHVQNLHLTANPLEAQREMETALMNDFYASQAAPNYQHVNYNAPPEYYGNDTLQKREPPSGLSRHNSNDEFGQADTLYQRGPAGYSTTSSAHQYQLLQQQQQQQLQLQQQLALQQYYEGQGTLTGRSISHGSQYGSNYRLQHGSQQQLHQPGFLGGSHQALHHHSGVGGGAGDNDSVYSYFSQFDTYAQTPSYLVEQSCQTAERSATGPQSRNHYRRKRRRQREPEMAAGASAANHAPLSQLPIHRDMATNTIEEEVGGGSVAAMTSLQHQFVPGVPPLPSHLHRDSDPTYEPLPEETHFRNIYNNTSGKQAAYHSNSTPTSSLRSRRSTSSNGATVIAGALSTVKEHTPPPPPPGQFAGSLTSMNTVPSSSAANGLSQRQLLRPATSTAGGGAGGAGASLFKRGVSPLFSDPPRMRDISDYAIPETRT